MTFSNYQEIYDMLELNPNKGLIATAVAKHNELNMHVNGVGVKEHLASLKDYETKLQTEVGQKIVESNKGVFNALLHPLNKVFSAKGGSGRYDLPNRYNQEFKEKLKNVAHGMPIRKWLESKILNKYITDPNGVLFIEVGNNEAKPTFKGITSIYDYSYIGQKVEYIVFNPEKIEGTDKVFFRVVDDSFDYYIEADSAKDKKTYKVNESKTFPVHFEACPARVVSDIFDDTNDTKSSFVSCSLEKANTFLYDNSVHAKHKLLFGFAKYWEYGRDCVPCNGLGVVEKESNDGYLRCNHCNGTGKRPFGDVSDKIVLDLPQSKDDIIMGKLSGFDTPDLKIWAQYKEDLKDHEKDLFRILWNINYISEQKTRTATESMLEIQPIDDKRHGVADNFESLEAFTADNLGYFYYEKQYKGSLINYGRRYLNESPDALLEKLTNAIKSKLPVVIILNIAKEYTQALYANNETESAIQIKLLELEPFPFMEITEVVELNISEEEKKKKIFFQEWVRNKSETELLLKDKPSLEADLQEFINKKEYKNGTQEISKNQQRGQDA